MGIGYGRKLSENVREVGEKGGVWLRGTVDDDCDQGSGTREFEDQMFK